MAGDQGGGDPVDPGVLLPELPHVGVPVRGRHPRARLLRRVPPHHLGYNLRYCAVRRARGGEHLPQVVIKSFFFVI